MVAYYEPLYDRQRLILDLKRLRWEKHPLGSLFHILTDLEKKFLFANGIRSNE